MTVRAAHFRADVTDAVQNELRDVELLAALSEVHVAVCDRVLVQVLRRKTRRHAPAFALSMKASHCDDNWSGLFAPLFRCSLAKVDVGDGGGGSTVNTENTDECWVAAMKPSAKAICMDFPTHTN